MGVPVHALPVNSSSELLREAHLAWIEKWRESERTGIRVEATPSGPDLVEDDPEDYSQLTESTSSEYERGPRRRLDGNPPESFQAFG